MAFKDSNTYKNLQYALDRELKASTKYEIYGMKAREDGFEQIGNIYDESSQHKREHAKIWMKIMNKGELPYTLDNLKDSYSGETREFTNRYPQFAQEAREEGYDDIALLFDGVAGIETLHNYRFRKLADHMEAGEVFCKQDETLWMCLNCGNAVKGGCAPRECPVCGSPQGFFQLLNKNF